MPAPVIYTPPAFQRYFGWTADPNSAAGGSNVETIAADTTGFPSGIIPDVTAVVPVTTATHGFTPTPINRDDEASGIAASRPNVPFKVSPAVNFSAKGYRWIIEKALKYVMGTEGTITGSGPYMHPLSILGFGSNPQLPSGLMQLIRDGINVKSAGAVLESVDLTFPFDDASTVEIEAHPLYSKIVTTAMPTGAATEPAALPMLIRDAQVVFDGGGSSAVSISQFTFGVKRNSNYNRQVAGHCIDSTTIGSPSLLRQLWFPHYHKLSERHAVTWGLDFLDTQVAQELAAQWGQVQKIVVTVGEAGVPANDIEFDLFATETTSDGGVGALTATGDQTSSFSGNAFYSASDGTDVTVKVTNQTSTAIL